MAYKTTSKREFCIRFTIAIVCVFCLAAPAFARDLTGLIDLNGKEIIPCKYRSMEYIGCGFYLAEEIPDPNSKGKQLLNLIPRDLLEKVEKHSEYSEKVLLTRNGARLNPKIPKDAVLTHIYLPSGDDRWTPVKIDKFEAKALPNDAIVYFLNKKGFGACDAKGDILVKPSIEALKEKYVYDVCPVASRFIPKKEQKKSTDCLTKFENPRRYSEGLGVFHDEHWKLGYMDESGRVVLAAKFDSASDFSDGMAAVCPGPDGGGYCFIDKTGAKVSPSFDYVSEYSNGIAAAGKSIPRKRIFAEPHGSYYIDKQYKVISPTFAEAGTFHGNIAVVRPVGDPGKPELGLVDRNFHYRFLCSGDREFKFHKGYWIIEDSTAPTIVLDSEGKEVFQTPVPARLEDGFGGLMFRSCGDLNQLFFYDKDGQFMCAPRFEKHWLFSTRLPVVLVYESNEWTGMRGIFGTGGVWLVSPERAHFEITEVDRATKSKFGKFERDDWRIQDEFRDHELYAFLRDYNPIGMSRSQMESLLGSGNKQEGDFESIDKNGLDPNIASYQLNWFGAGCGSSMWFAEFRYQNDRVKEWRIYKRTEQNNPWIRS